MKVEHWNIAAELFADDLAHVLAAAKVHKCPMSVSQLAKLHKALKPSGKPRLLVLTGVWDAAADKVQLALHSCKQIGLTFKVIKAFPLSNLAKMEVYQGEPGLLTSVQALELTFVAGATETHLACQTADEGTLLQILAPLWHYAQKFPASEQKRPGLVTYPNNTVSLVVQLEAWNANHLDPDAERKLTAAQCGGGGEGEGERGEEEGEEGQVSLVSAKEERDLQALLDRFAMEVGDIEDFQQRLQDELAALEAANVHTVLASGPSVARVRRSLDDALGVLEDLNENLATFDTKLMVMREDIAAIEARNNKLELQTRNNGKLLSALELLLERLQLPQREERALRAMLFASHNLEEMVKAGWELYDHLEALSEADPAADGAAGISPALAHMAAVTEQRARFAVVAKAYAQRASAFIGEELVRMTNGALTSAAAPGRSRAALPDHAGLHKGTQILSTLLHVVRSLQPDVLDTLGGRYTGAFNTLLRRELRLYTSDLRRTVAAAAAHLPPEPTLLRGVRKEDLKAMQSVTGHLSSMSALQLSEPLGSMSSAGSFQMPVLPQRPPLHATNGYAHGGGEPLQPHQAYTQLLDEWMPMLTEELDSCAEFLMLKSEQVAKTHSSSLTTGSSGATGGHTPRPGRPAGEETRGCSTSIVDGGEAALQALLEGVTTDFLVMADLANRQQQQIQAVPMLAATLRWQSKLGGTPLVAPLTAVLEQCRARLLANFARFVDETAAAVQRYEPRGALVLSDGVKSIHVLPFVPNFGSMVSRLEELHEATEGGAAEDGSAEEEAEAENGSGSENSDDACGSDEAEDVHREVSLLVGPAVGRRQQTAAFASSSEELRRHLKQGLVAGLQTGLQGLQRARGMGVKAMRRRKGRPRNLLDTVESADGHSEDEQRVIASLTEADIPTRIPDARHVHSAREVVDAAYALLSRAIFVAIERIATGDPKRGDRLRLENYLLFVEMLAAHRAHNGVITYFTTAAAVSKTQALQGVEQLSRDVGPEEVPFQPGFLAADLRSTLVASVGACERRLEQLHARIARHLQGNTQLTDLVWRELRGKLEGSYDQLAGQVARLYPSLQLPISPEALRAYLITLG